ncbi:hypothetical protein B0O99DRAFT_742758 [Bisporella sp. PMI_857]|nr:hypothetical protein B0O99DRAFT_742758 [Bisporella sp. PMI_857]
MAFSLNTLIWRSPIARLLAFGLVIGSVSATCYLPNGEIPVETVFAPCNSNSSAVSMCCNSVNSDRCSPEGLCISGSDAYWRNTCTDPTWTAPECVKMCMDIFWPRVHECTDGTWCCGAPDNTTCCDSGKGVKLLTTGTATHLVSTPSPTSSPSASSSATTSTSTAAETAAAADKSSSGGKKSNSVAIGVGVGVGVAALLALVALGFFFYRRRQHKKRSAVEPPNSANTPEGFSDRDMKNSQTKTTVFSAPVSPPAQHQQGSIEDGGVMTALATGGVGMGETHSPDSSTTQAARPLGTYANEGRIHEMPSRENFQDPQELPVNNSRPHQQNSFDRY